MLKKLPVSGGIESDILLPPETGNFFKHLSQLPVSGDIESDILMPPETGKTNQATQPGAN